MSRGVKPAKAKVEAKRPAGRTPVATNEARVHELELRLAEALEQQAATSEILRVIGSSPTDLQPVLDAIVARAARLCDSVDAQVFRVDGDVLRPASSYGSLPKITAGETRPISRGSVNGRAVVERRTIHVHDLAAESESEWPEAKAFQRRFGHRTTVATPLLREGVPLGVITIRRVEVRPFSDDQIKLLETFADQAAIAIENARLFNETKEALERQTATSQILQVISQSTMDVQPVFDTIVAAAMKLCHATSANAFTFDGELIHLAALVNATPEGADAIRHLWPRPPGRDLAAARAILTCRAVAVPDVLEDSDFASRASAAAANFRSVLAVPLVREGSPIGAIAVGRPDPGPFPDEQIALLQTFADQAVIAIENARLFNETKEALERQTATSDILRVISQSPTDVQPVFDTIVRSAVRLCGADFSMAARFDGELLHPLAFHGFSPEALEIAARKFPMHPTRENMLGRVALSRKVEKSSDTLADPDYSHEFAIAGGWRSVVGFPLLRDGDLIGAITVGRTTPGAFPNQSLELLKTFADQAVIAIENVRLFNETKEALERQTATSAILRVISQSQTDVQPVFDAIVEATMKLCHSSAANVFTFDGEQIHLAAVVNVNPDYPAAIRQVFPRPPGRDTAVGRAILSRNVVIIPDVLEDSEYAIGVQTLAGGFRSVLAVPLIRDENPIGVIIVGAREPGHFPDKQIDLLKTFADQAVIAIENVRLFNETKQALERQTATAEILRVIGGSMTDTQPVFDAIVKNCHTLFKGSGVVLRLVRDGRLLVQASSSATLESVPIDRESVVGTCVLEARTIHVPDIEAMAERYPRARQLGLKMGYRSGIYAPLLREGTAIGSIGILRPDVGAFDDKEVALLGTFADQAVIAIENVRLFKELEARTEALTRTVGQLTALGEVGQAVSSTLELETVLRTIVSRAVHLTGLDGGSIFEYDERAEEFRLQAAENMPQDVIEDIRKAPTRKGDGALGRTAITLEPTQVPDTFDDSYQSARKELLIRAGYRALLAVPLLREDHLLGGLLVNRKTPGEFAPEIVALLKTFATQSALAIQNARLFREIAEKGRQLEEASRHKSQFLASMSHELRTPLNAILGFNEMILGAIYGEVPAGMKEPLEDIQTSGKHLLRLINNVLDLAKIEAGRMELSLADYSVHDTVESVRATLRPLAADKGLEFVATVPADIPLAYGDFGRITQCLMNLAGNSLKFTKAGKVEISVATKGDLLVYQVADTGIGIPPDKLETVFAEFKQTDATIASEYGGTGLGLSISRKFVEMHGGRIWVESELGRGSTFIFEIPLRAESTVPK